MKYVLLGLGLVLLVFTIVPKEVYSDHYNDWYDARNFYNLQDQIRDFYDDGDYDIDWDDRYYYRDYDCYDDDRDCDRDCDDRDCYDDHDCDDDCWRDCDDDDYYRCDNDDYNYHDDDDYRYKHDEDYKYEKKYESDVKIKDNNNREQKVTFEIENYYDYSDGKGGKLKDSEIIMKGDNTNKNDEDDD